MAANKLREQDVRTCFVGLYHATSKDLHGFTGQVTISELDWSKGEQFALAALFKFHHVPFVFMDELGQIKASEPFDLSEF
jgi:hypothetical protein